MKFRPEFSNYRESPWILITLPDTRRVDHAVEDAPMTNRDVRKSRLPFGIHHMVTKNNALTSATWPRPKLKITKPRVAFEAEDDRPKTATLDHPKILDIAFLGKIDMTSLSKKSLMSIANLCILPMKESKRSGGALLGGRGAKTRRFAPHRSPSPRVRRPSRFVNSDKETNSESESVRSAGKFPPQSKTPPTKSTNLKVKPQGSVTSEKSLDSSSDKELKKRAVITKRLKNVVDVFGGVVTVSEPCTTCGRSDQPERLHSHPVPPCAMLKTLAVVSPRAEVKSSVRKPVPIRYRSEKARQQDDVVKTPEHKKEDVATPVKAAEKKKEAVTTVRSTESERSRRKEETPVVVRTPDPHATRRREETQTVLRTDPERVNRREVTRTPDLYAGRRREDGPAVVRTPDPYTSRRRDVARTPETRRPQEAAKSPDPDAGMTGKGRQGPKTTVCYICGRGFGSASFPLHEPQCMQRWHRENALLAPHLQRSAPQKPDMAVNSDDWNRSAYMASQAQLVSCDNCGRTFNPDRLEVHQRSCRPGGKRFGGAHTKSADESGSESEGPGLSRNVAPPAVYCYVCGRMFGSKSIGIHEPKCLAKWHVENEQLPSHQRRQEPQRPGQSSVPPPAPAPPTSTSTTGTGKKRPGQSSVPSPAPAAPPTAPPTSKSPSSTSTTGTAKKRPAAVPCYLCGRQFGTTSINIHEPQCLKKWRIENEKLPVAKRRPEPEKPDIVFDPVSGQIDFQGTMDAIWETHLGQLIACKHCSRTFNPDRVDVHERSCKGPRH